MQRSVMLKVAGCLFASGLLLAACAPGARAPATPFPATAVSAAVAAVPSPISAAASADEGGITTVEPAPVPNPRMMAAATGQPTATAAATGLPIATATAQPALPPTATDQPAMTAAPALAATLLPDGSPALTATATFVPSQEPNPLQIEVMRRQGYPGSEITFEQTLDPGANYNRYVVSYKSDGYKIYALMTVPAGEKPATGWPVIVFNHGFIPPAQYRTTERYVAYVDAIAQAGYIVFKSDYRGHGSSEGPTSGGGYYAPGYTDDVLNAVASLKAYKDADPNRIGMWGHSMGGQLTLRAMVVTNDIKAGVIWGGVVAPYPNIFARANYNERAPFGTRAGPTPAAGAGQGAAGPGGQFGRSGARDLIAKYGTSEQNPQFWASISPNSYLADLSGPLQLDHSVTDEEVPVAASKLLYTELQAAGKPSELYTYAGDNHNISANFALAMQRTIAFFDRYVKGA